MYPSKCDEANSCAISATKTLTFKTKKMKTISKIILTAAFAVISLSAFAQIGVGTTTPDASAALDITASNKGFLMPRMATAERTAIASPASGLQVYDTNTKSIWYFDGTVWVEQASGSAAKFVDGTNPADAVFTGGYVGIGTATPAGLLYLNTDTDGYDVDLSLDTGASLIGDQANAKIEFMENGTIEWRLLSRQEDNLIDRFEIVEAGEGARFTIDAGGKIGIGTQLPQDLLHINTDILGDDASLALDSGESLIGDQANATIAFAENGIDQWRIVSRQEASLTDHLEIVKVGQGTRLTVDANGYVGIGTMTPQNLLHINTDEVAEDAAFILDSGPSLSGNQANSRIMFSENGTSEWMLISRQEGPNADRFEIVEMGGATRITIASGGNVGIGTQSPTSKLQVVGLPVYANNAAAASAGLTNGAFYRTSTGQVMVKY